MLSAIKYKKPIFRCFTKISTNATKEFGSRCSFKDMNFSDSGFRFTFIFGSGNHKSHDIFSFILSTSIKQALFMALRSSFFTIFGKLQERNNVLGSIICYVAGLWTETLF